MLVFELDLPDWMKASLPRVTSSTAGGSVTGKYHHPGRPSYDRATHVVKWFCSEDEARNEGYNKPGNCR
jgi:hypothetical protein